MRCLGADVSNHCRCCNVQSNTLMDKPPFRESLDPNCFSTYSRFWSSATSWERFLLPPQNPGGKPIKGPAIDRTSAEAGVYEFGVSMPQAPSTIVTLYVGKSSNIRSRHLDYLNDGSHLEDLMQSMLSQNCTIWQRLRYTATDLQCQRWEARCLIEFDYAWNAVLNPPKRRVHLEYRDCCGCFPLGVDVVDKIDHKRVSLFTKPIKTCFSFTTIFSVILQILVAITIISIVAVQLADPAQIDIGKAVIPGRCYLGTSAQGNSLCVYAYVVSALSLILSIMLSALLIARFTVGSCSHTMTMLMMTAATIWWVAAAIVFTRYATDADSKPPSDIESNYHGWRRAVCALAWTEAAAWGLSLLVEGALAIVRCFAHISLGTSYVASVRRDEEMDLEMRPSAPPKSQFLTK